MEKILSIAVVLALAAGAASAAQLYRWVDEKGAVEYRDTPPPSTARNVEQRTLSSNTIETSTSLPYSVQQAVKNYPVTLWTFDCGDPCKLASAHLAKRGIPHTVRYSNKEPEVLKKLAGGTEVPVLLVGSTQLKGYLETSWDAALDSAGYPRTPPSGMKPQVKVAESSKGSEPAKGKEPASKPAGDAAPKGSPAPAAK